MMEKICLFFFKAFEYDNRSSRKKRNRKKLLWGFNHLGQNTIKQIQYLWITTKKKKKQQKRLKPIDSNEGYLLGYNSCLNP